MTGCSTITQERPSTGQSLREMEYKLSQSALEMTWEETPYSEQETLCEVFNEDEWFFVEYMTSGIETEWDYLTREDLKEIASDFFSGVC